MAGIQGIGSGIAAVGTGRAPQAPSEDGVGGFGQMLDALGSASGSADAAVSDLAVGGDVDLHDVMLAVEMESMAFDLALQIRNRMVEAYQEVFRMQV